MSTDTETRQDPQISPATSPDEAAGRGSRWGSLLMAVAMVVLGVGLGWLVFGGGPSTGDEAAPTGDTTATEASAPADQEPATDGDVSPAEEPVAAVAEALLPSVVQIETPTGLGSGVIYDSEGLILTAAHVVAGSDQVTVWLSDGSRFEGEVLGGDLPTDIAVVEVDASDLPAAPLALEEDLQVGQLAVAIGSPFGLDSTVTSGVVSALNQTVRTATGDFQSLIQTDAPINPGNSGGALANRDGEVIGINVSIFSTSRGGGNVGVGFAVPVDVAYDLAQSVVAGEPIERAVLGIQGTNTESGAAGALVTGVQEGSGAAEADLEVGDVITSVEGVRVEGIGDLVAQLRQYQPGETVTLEVVRGGESMRVDVELGTR
ncbi:MAG: S1C family serine protease [Actinomycetota bacterium]